MGYRGRRGYYRRPRLTLGQERAIEHVRAYNDLERRLGPIVEDIKLAFFNLDNKNLSSLFHEYSSRYGASAEEYARKTFNEWKAGQRKMSGQTAQRLIDLVPRYLTYEQKYNIVKKLCGHHAKKVYRQVEIYLDDVVDGMSSLNSVIRDFYTGSQVKELPEHVIETVSWLNDHDITAARALLAQVDQKVATMTAATAAEELEKIQAVIRKGALSEAKHEINFPNGTLVVNLRKRGFIGKLLKGIFG
jgi:enamine deaminase RidA (YjgF/YER057c/UK114 family)